MGDIDELITRLQDSNTDIRSDTVEALAEISDSRSVVCSHSVTALGKIGHTQALPAVRVALKTETGGKMPIIQLEEMAEVERDDSVRRAAERILKK